MSDDEGPRGQLLAATQAYRVGRQEGFVYGFLTGMFGSVGLIAVLTVVLGL